MIATNILAEAAAATHTEILPEMTAGEQQVAFWTLILVIVTGANTIMLIVSTATEMHLIKKILRTLRGLSIAARKPVARRRVRRIITEAREHVIEAPAKITEKVETPAPAETETPGAARTIKNMSWIG